jgi:hypothetical protein
LLKLEQLCHDFGPVGDNGRIASIERVLEDQKSRIRAHNDGYKQLQKRLVEIEQRNVRPLDPNVSPRTDRPSSQSKAERNSTNSQRRLLETATKQLASATEVVESNAAELRSLKDGFATLKQQLTELVSRPSGNLSRGSMTGPLGDTTPSVGRNSFAASRGSLFGALGETEPIWQDQPHDFAHERDKAVAATKLQSAHRRKVAQQQTRELRHARKECVDAHAESVERERVEAVTAMKRRAEELRCQQEIQACKLLGPEAGQQAHETPTCTQAGLCAAVEETEVDEDDSAQGAVLNIFNNVFDDTRSPSGSLSLVQSPSPRSAPSLNGISMRFL